MTLEGNGRRIVVFGSFHFDLLTRELLKNGIRLRLEEKPALVLQQLIQKAGSVVTRDELRLLLWPAGVHVDFNHGLNKSINRVRAVLGDDRVWPRYVETLSRRGYRFIAPVEFVSEPQMLSPDKSRDSMIERLTTATGSAIAEEDAPAFMRNSPQEEECGDATNKPFTYFLLTGRNISRKLLLTATAVLLIGMTLRAVYGNRREKLEPTQTIINLPSDVRLMTTSENLGIAISPDGTQIVFSAVGPNGRPQLWLRRLGSSQQEAIPGTEDGVFPFWSPDGKDLGFFAGLQLKRVSLADHSVKSLCSVETARGGTWSSDGIILFAPGTRGPIYKIGAEGGTPSALTALDETRYTTHRWPTFLPDGRHFVYLAANHDKSWAPGAIFLGSLDRGQAKLLGESDSNVASVSGSLLFLSHGKLMSQSLDMKNSRIESQARIIADTVEFDRGLWYGDFTATAEEVVYRSRQENSESETISWFDRKGNKLVDVGPSGIYRELSLAPNGKIIAVISGDPEPNVCLIHNDGTVTQVTHGEINGNLAWTNDSSAVSYFTHRGRGSFAIGIKPLNDSTIGHVLLAATTSIALTSWHPDNRHALIARVDDKGHIEYLIFDSATGKLTPYLPADSGTEDARFSPDGHWVAYTKQEEHETDRVHLVSYPQPTLDYAVTIGEGRSARWRGDGHELYFLGSGENLYSVSISIINGNLKIGTPELLFRPPIPPAPWNRGSYDVTRDGKRFLLNTVTRVETPQLTLTTNWQR